MAANLKEVRTRIKSVISTQQITKAMKMVSAAKLRRAQQAIVQFRPYSNALGEMLSNVLAASDGGNDGSSFGVEREVSRACVVVVTSSKGLCGAFNANIVKAAIEVIETRFAAQRAAGSLSLLFIGKKGYEAMRRRYDNCHLHIEHIDLFAELTYENTEIIAHELIELFAAKQFDAIEVAYGQFRNAALQNFVVERFLPVPKPEANAANAKVKAMKPDFIFEPNETELIEQLVPSILKAQLFKCCLDTHASEHGARMTAMDKATENANDLLRDLRINYNKARQESITKELSEIVGGAAALEG